MNIKALLTTLVLGSSSVAMAEPIQFSGSAQASAWWSVPSVRVDRRDVITRDHRSPWVYSYGNDRDYSYGERRYDQPRAYEPRFDDRGIEVRNTRIVNSTTSEYIGQIMSRPDGDYGWNRPRWFAVTDPTRIDSGRLFIYPRFAGHLDRIMLKQVAGASFVQQVTVAYVDGGAQVFNNLSTQLDDDHRTLRLNLDKRHGEISRVIIYGSSAPHSAFQMMAL